MSDQLPSTVHLQTSAGFVAAGGTDVGKIREVNEDSLLIIPEPSGLPGIQIFAAVADGMGRHVGGAIASRTAVDTLQRYICDISQSAKLQSDPTEVLEQVIKQANQAIQSQAAAESLHGMGTTITVAMVGETSVVIANVGDSRAYLLRAGSLTQVTEDHSLVWEQVQRGLIPKESLETHPQRNILTRALGIAPHVSVDIFPLLLEPSDVIVLCSDGLYHVVDHEYIRRALANRTPEDACDHLIVTANAHGGPDNVTLVIVQIPNG